MIVFVQALFDIIGTTDIERVIGTAKDISVEHALIVSQICFLRDGFSFSIINLLNETCLHFAPIASILSSNFSNQARSRRPDPKSRGRD